MPRVWYVRLGLGLAVLAIIAFTLLPSAENDASGWVSCFVCGSRGGAAAILNIALFVPFGAGLAVAGVRVPRIWLLGALLSAGIEYAQLFIPGRQASVADVIFNSSGALVGSTLALGLARSVRRAQPPSPLHALVTCALSTGVIAVTGWLLQPAFPASTYFGQWTPNLGHLGWYRGRVLEASADGVPLPPGQLAATARVRVVLAAGATLRVRALAGPPVPRLAPLFSIFDEREREIVLLGPDGDDLVFRYRTRAAAWRLAEPDIRVPGAMRGTRPGDTLTVVVRRAGSTHCLTVNHAETCGLGFTVGDGWTVLMYPDSLPRPLTRLLGIAWLAGLLLPAGYWGASRWGVLIATGTAALSLAVVAPAAGLVATPPGQWLGAAAGLLLGAACRTALVRQTRNQPGSAPGVSDRTNSPTQRSILA